MIDQMRYKQWFEVRIKLYFELTTQEVNSDFSSQSIDFA